MTVPTTAPRHELTLGGVRTVAAEAYVFLYPLVLMDLTRQQMTSLSAGTAPGAGPIGRFSHVRQFPPGDFRGVVRPNFDTLYSIAWLDLTETPMVLSVPDTGGRYYLLPLYDMWTDAFAVPGKRTTGTGPGEFAVLPPGWHGDLPPDLPTIPAPTRYAWVVGRTQTNGPSDYPAVHAVQDGLDIRPLSGRVEVGVGDGVVPGGRDTSSRAGVDTETPPLEQVNAMSAREFFRAAAAAFAVQPPHFSDWSMVARLRHLGLQPGAPFDESGIGPARLQALEAGVADARTLMRRKAGLLAPVVNGWQTMTETIGVYGNDYVRRAVVAMVGLGANPPEDAVYPLNVCDAEGQPLHGDHDYRLHFAPHELPPVDAFWSVTMYDADGFPVPNPLERYALGDRDPLMRNGDGSLDLYLQQASPGPDREANWLPAGSGLLGVTMRLYAPRAEVFDGRWSPPPITRTR